MKANKRKLAAKPELIDKMTPKFPPLASRPIRIDSEDSVFDALLRDDVTLVTDHIERITPKSIVAGGTKYEVDGIVFATCFRANDYLWPIEVRGRGGIRVEEAWAKDGPRAYLGAMVPQFPNMFMVYGPIDIRRMWKWLNDPAGAPPEETDAGLRLYSNEDLVVN